MNSRESLRLSRAKLDFFGLHSSTIARWFREECCIQKRNHNDYLCSDSVELKRRERKNLATNAYCKIEYIKKSYSSLKLSSRKILLRSIIFNTNQCLAWLLLHAHILHSYKYELFYFVCTRFLLWSLQR